jgi:Fur family zinc uptake transcriptional regulator
MAKKKETGFADARHNHQACITRALRRAEELCQRNNRRFTETRKRVLEIVWSRHKPIGAYEVLELLQQESRSAPPKVYRALDFLQQMGLVHRIASLNAYVGCTAPGEPHDGHFLICESCRALAELDAPSITSAINQSAEASGFQSHRHTVEIMGLCPDCRV